MKFKEYKLSDLIELKSQGVNTTTDKISYSDTGIRIIQAKNINKFKYSYDEKNYIDEETFNKMKENHKLHSGEVLYTNIGSQLGNAVVYESNERAIITWNVMKLIPKERLLDNYYLCYWLNNNSDYIRNLNSSSTMPFVSGETLLNIKIKIPELEIQKRISKIIRNITNKIKENSYTNNNLYEICNSIFHIFLNKYSDLIIYTKLVDIAKKIITGKTPSTKNEEFWSGNIPFITIPDMHNQVFTINTERTINELGAKSLIPKNSISVSCIATVGLVSITTEESQTNQQINSIVINNDYDLYYLFEFLSEQTEYLKSIAGGSTTYNINKKTFENIVIPYLPEKLLIRFNEQVSCLFKRIKENQIENKTLEQLRDMLLPKLMNGEIDLDNVEI